MLEDIFWESSITSYVQDEYYTLLQNTKDNYYFNKQELLYTSQGNIQNKKILKGTNTNYFSNKNNSLNYNLLPIYIDDFFINTNCITNQNYKLFLNESNYDTLDDIFDNIKYLSYKYYINNKNILNINNSYILPVSYTSVLDNFRSDYEENNILFDSVSKKSHTLNKKNLITNNDLRTSNLVKLRSTSKNSLVTYNAIQKVFKPRYDEGRSFSRLSDLTNSYVNYMFMTDGKIKYESFLGKNKESFFNTTNYKLSLSKNFSIIDMVKDPINIYLINIPFLLSYKSDSSRYLWFD
jgi:hypothetical protein